MKAYMGYFLVRKVENFEASLAVNEVKQGKETTSSQLSSANSLALTWASPASSLGNGFASGCVGR